MCTTRRPAASNACARASTSITSKGSISAARRAVSLSMTVRDYNFLVDEQLKKNALEYHRRKPAGKISVLPTKQLTNQRDLGLAYTPGVAAACEEIVRDPAQAFDMTSRANLIAVVTNGTAVLGLGAAALACLELLVKMGLPLASITVTDIKGVVYKGRREEMDPDKERYAKDTRARTLDEVIAGADVFLGLSAGGVLKPSMVKKMAERPLILALANPEPEILPELAKAAKPDCVIATGRSDYPNQVNNVLCFPFIFRGALDVGATTINTEMELAAAHAIAALAQAETSEQVALAYGIESISFGPEYIIPRPFDPRLIARVAPAVPKAAIDSAVPARPIADLDAYRDSMTQYVYHFGLLMKPVFSAAN